jgi:hypothetical protein
VSCLIQTGLVEGVPLAEVSQKHGSRVTLFCNWQKILFEGEEELFARSPNSASVLRLPRDTANPGLPDELYPSEAEVRRLPRGSAKPSGTGVALVAGCSCEPSAPTGQARRGPQGRWWRGVAGNLQLRRGKPVGGCRARREDVDGRRDPYDQYDQYDL